jgi:nitrite reductase/ring-hydroxylating ferredoxin subunit
MAFTKVVQVNEIAPGRAKQLSLAGKTLALFNVNGTFYAVDNECPHRGGPLADGSVEGTEVECPWHGAKFNLDTGEHLSPPARSGVKCYPVQVVGDEVHVDI